MMIFLGKLSGDNTCNNGAIKEECEKRHFDGE